MPTRSDWTAFADNGHHGTDAFAPISYLAKKIECDGVSATDAQAGRTQGGTLFEMYSPKNTDCLNIARTISASPTDGRWNFCMSGIMLPFEKPEFYKRKRVKDRFNAAILKQYLEELGINAFDPEFYSNDGILVEKTGASAPTMQQFDLAF